MARTSPSLIRVTTVPKLLTVLVKMAIKRGWEVEDLTVLLRREWDDQEGDAVTDER